MFLEKLSKIEFEGIVWDDRQGKWAVLLKLKTKTIRGRFHTDELEAALEADDLIRENKCFEVKMNFPLDVTIQINF